ncbi:MAG: ABC transporter ATP-binding protein [Bacteroidia bacterium]|nr:ABC transporter ATP-binding protein [Bacteroidia bacterium]
MTTQNPASFISSRVVHLDQVSKTYHRTLVPVQALENIYLTIEKGEFTVLVGTSGCGKTTLLNLIGGLDRPSSGHIWVAGVQLNQLKDRQLINFRLHHIGFIFQSYNLIPVLTVWENIAFIMQLQKRPYREIADRVETLLVKVGLINEQHRRPYQLSGGQQQRVAIARALAARPTLVLADEVTASVDSQTASALIDLMLHLNQEENITFLLSTHDDRVVNQARRVIRLEDGKVKSDEQQQV